ncbi:hypothetical protein AB0H76_21620 [Nocardia sp. NPDC050712]|uniref:hypothetical protein n=1 Tax=Nocardia sp. NPDC050712 TaxID=3155518 RepID=UPI0033F873B2
MQAPRILCGRAGFGLIALASALTLATAPAGAAVEELTVSGPAQHKYIGSNYTLTATLGGESADLPVLFTANGEYLGVSAPDPAGRATVSWKPAFAIDYTVIAQQGESTWSIVVEVRRPQPDSPGSAGGSNRGRPPSGSSSGGSSSGSGR